MNLPHADLSHIEQQLHELASLVWEAWDGASSTSGDLQSPLLLRDAATQLLRHLDRISQPPKDDRRGNPAELSTLGEYGLHLIVELGETAERLELSDTANQIQALSFPFALWIARNGGDIRDLTPVVDAFAGLANQHSDPRTMADLYGCCCELIEAASATYQDTENPRHAWRLLLLNRAIVATRSHNLELMVAAYDAIVELLPADAEPFFSQGMEQIAVIDYPETVADLVRRYYFEYAKPKHLH